MSSLAFVAALLLVWRVARQTRELRVRTETLQKEVAERSEAERRLRDSEERLTLVLEAANLGLWDRNLVTGAFVVNRQWGEMLGYGQGDLTPGFETWKSLIHPDDLPQALAALNSHIQQQTPYYECEYRMRTKAGDWRWVLSRGKAMERDAQGQPLRIAGTHLDVTDRRESEERYRQLFQSMHYGFALHEIICDERGKPVDYRFLEVNPAFSQLTGLSAEQVAGKRVREALPRVEPYWIEMYGEVALTGVPRNFESYSEPLRRHYDGVAFSPQKGRFVVIFRDITERKAAEEERRRLEADLQHSQKLESLGVLAGGIAHDFNNLLMGILGNVDLARDDVPPNSPAQGCLKEIALAGKRAADLCRQMLAYSGKGQFVLERLDLNKAVQGIASLLHVSISKTVVMRFHYGHDLPAMLADASQIRQVAMNLITNASEAIGGVSGIIHVTTGAQDCGHDYIAECVLGEGKAEGTYVFLEVTDTGMGIERDLLPRIFDPFFTTKFPGRGLGLAAVLGIVRAHRGFIRVTTRPARGTSFRVHLPVAPAAANGEPVRVAPEASGAVTDQAPGTRQTILFVDDDETIRTVARRILTKVGHRVLLASDGREAVHMFTEHADHVDAVVLDLSMPHMSGAETFQEIRKLRPNVPILVSSGYSEQHMSDQFRGIGPAEFLQKPYPAEALVARMDVLLGRKTG